MTDAPTKDLIPWIVAAVLGTGNVGQVFVRENQVERVGTDARVARSQERAAILEVFANQLEAKDGQLHDLQVNFDLCLTKGIECGAIRDQCLRTLREDRRGSAIDDNEPVGNDGTDDPGALGAIPRGWSGVLPPRLADPSGTDGRHLVGYTHRRVGREREGGEEP